MQREGKKKVLVCPLDWGIGHATRCIPIIEDYLDHNWDVIIAADKNPLKLLKAEFPKLTYIQMPGYDISYPQNGNMTLAMLLQSPKILWGIYKEHQQLKKIIKAYNIYKVISDNRYGLWNIETDSIFLTHQIMIKCPKQTKFLEPILYQVNKWFINKYNQCWVPDYEGENNLAGDLSHKFPLPKNAIFYNPLSRFRGHKKGNNETHNFKYDLMCILSGPEPQRTLLEETLLKELNKRNEKVLFLRGKPEATEIINTGKNITVYNHLGSEKMKEVILSSNIILSRPGYSSIMDLAALGKEKLIFIPTPGQTEQEYLALYHSQKNNVVIMNQEKINLQQALSNF